MYIRPFYFLSLHCKSTGDAPDFVIAYPKILR